jgi:two-component system cell cycle response regulator
VEDVRESIARAERKRAALVVLQGSEGDIGMHVLLDQPVTLGRDPGVELPLQDEGISRRHCVVTSHNSQFFVEDLGSTNGTLLNGTRLEKGPYPLKPADRIYLGACVVKFTYADALEVGYHAQMDTLIGTDDLTGLIAKRRFDAAFLRAVDAARTSREPLGVMMLDMDGLKRINDTHGHPVGAHTIAEVGRILGSLIGEKGAVCRFGGDEFAAFLPGYSRSQLQTLGEQIRVGVASHQFEYNEIILCTTISIGISIQPEDGETPDQLLRKADEALYRAKRAGRDQVVS